MQSCFAIRWVSYRCSVRQYENVLVYRHDIAPRHKINGRLLIARYRYWHFIRQDPICRFHTVWHDTDTPQDPNWWNWMTMILDTYLLGYLESSGLACRRDIVPIGWFPPLWLGWSSPSVLRKFQFVQPLERIGTYAALATGVMLGSVKKAIHWAFRDKRAKRRNGVHESIGVGRYRIWQCENGHYLSVLRLSDILYYPSSTHPSKTKTNFVIRISRVCIVMGIFCVVLHFVFRSLFVHICLCFFF